MMGRHAEGRVAWHLLADAAGAGAVGHARQCVHPRSLPPSRAAPDPFSRLTDGDLVPVETSAVLTGRVTFTTEQPVLHRAVRP